ncbi:30S ribosomal protein S1 [bioreactor metagenome]|uniref:30S ribosomal protein S1 n=1 Tax=bioreactor metagenome TaxID=1076179 RepID=A0A644Y707_9ZZZZ
MSVGDEVEVYILSVDKENKRLGLSLKATIEDPWNKVNENIKIGSVTEGTIKKLVNFGAFVEILPGIEGLVHLHEISEDNITKPDDKLQIGDKVKVKILEINKENKRVSLSIKEALEKNKDYEKYNKDEALTLGDLFNEKLKGLKFD